MKYLGGLSLIENIHGGQILRREYRRHRLPYITVEEKYREKVWTLTKGIVLALRNHGQANSVLRCIRLVKGARKGYSYLNVFKERLTSGPRLHCGLHQQ